MVNTIHHLRQAGRLGGLARIRKYGNPGTIQGRKRGGLNSLKARQRYPGNFKVLKKILYPSPSILLAELIGAFMGDGHVGIYQSSITTHSETDLEHAKYVKKIIEEQFGVSTTLRMKKPSKACEIVVSSKRICDFLHKQGLPQGNKIKKGITIPTWIQRNRIFSRAFVRGLFDTDGCVYTDTHYYKEKVYKSVGMAFSNRSLPLLHFFKSVLWKEKMFPTQKSNFAVFLRRKADIEHYFKIIGTSNPKHTRRLSIAQKLRGTL